jgi:xanthine dehydrogenase accessory factor
MNGLTSTALGRLGTSGLPRDWLPTLLELLEREPAVVRIVVAEVRGSTPREPGAFMLVGRDSVAGSIGGGQLEWEAVASARDLLADTAAAARVKKVVLAADVGQCCGGVVSVWLERFTREDLDLLRMASDAGARGCAVLSSTIAGDGVGRRVVRGGVTGAAVDARVDTGALTTGGTATAKDVSLSVRPSSDEATDRLLRARPSSDDATDRLLRAPRHSALPILTRNAAGDLTLIERLDDEFPAVWLYGAGHVGHALARILVDLPLRLTWIDSRAELLPDTIGGGGRILRDPDSLATVSEAPVGAYFIVMSHSHPLDYALCHALLERNDFAWLGLIGSLSKAARFRSRLTRAGLGADVIRTLVCPIGVEGIESKWPAAIAVAVAAQLMQQISAAGVERPEHRLEGSGAPRVQPARAMADRLEAASGDCAPGKCATCGSTTARRGTVTS